MKPSLAFLLLCLAPAPANAQTKEISRKIWVAPGGFVRLFNLAGSVTVQGWDQDSLQITGPVSTAGDGELVVSPGKQGAKVSLWGSEERSARGTLLVRVPRRSQLWVKTQDAAVTIADFEGGIDVMTGSGNVEISGRPRELYVESVGGAVNLAVTTRSARVKTGAGAVTLRGVIDEATVSTVGGPIFTMDSRITQARLESVEGRISFSGELATPGSMQIINHAGPIDLALAPKASGEFSVSIFDGVFKDEFGVKAKLWPAKAKGREYTFTLGARPDNDVQIRSFKGTVTIKRLLAKVKV